MKIENQNYYNSSRGFKNHEKFLAKIIIKNYSHMKDIKDLDLGCADGKFLKLLDENLNLKNIIGIDYDKKLINRAKKIKFIGKANFICSDFQKSNYRIKDIDIMIASGFYNSFDKPIKNLKKSLKFLHKKGNIFIFQRLNSFPIETKYFLRKPGQPKWKDKRILYYYKYFQKFLPKNRIKKSKKWNIDIDIRRKKNPFSTFTVKTKHKRYQLTNSNIVNEQFFLWTESKK